MTEAPRVASFSQGRKRYSRSVSGVGHQKSSRELFSRKRPEPKSGSEIKAKAIQSPWAFLVKVIRGTGKQIRVALRAITPLRTTDTDHGDRPVAVSADEMNAASACLPFATR